MEHEVLRVYEALKDRYHLVCTNTFALDEGFTANIPVIVGRAHGLILELYDADILVLDVMDEAQTKGTHWHPYDAEAAVQAIVDFFEKSPEYQLHPFPKHSDTKITRKEEKP